ncbi:Crossover junction endodeoxyribonuclease RuvC [Streptomyces violaceorubidus]
MVTRQVRESGGGSAAKEGPALRVLGVDPGLTRCGVGVVEGVAGRPLTMIGVGVVRTPADADLGHRLVAVEQGIEAWLDEHRPEFVAVERVRRVQETDNRTCSGRDDPVTRGTFAGAGTPVPC